MEDCPAPAFITWSFRSVTLSAEPALDLDRENPVSSSFEMYYKLVQLGQQLMDADLKAVSVRVETLCLDCFLKIEDTAPCALACSPTPSSLAFRDCVLIVFSRSRIQLHVLLHAHPHPPHSHLEIVS